MVCQIVLEDLSLILYMKLKFKAMKKVIVFLILLLSVNTSSLWSANELANDSNDVVLRKKDRDNPRPRMPEYVPIACFYSDGSLFFTFMEDLGELEISVTNLNTGVEIIDEIDSFCGNALLEVSESSGEYQIEITTETDDSYYGEYTL